MFSTSPVKEMNTRITLVAAIAIVAAFSGIAAVIGPTTVAIPAEAQNITGDNATMMGGNMTAANITAGGNWTQ